jgi:ABC-type Na+ efflux pump permease subunit
VARAWVVAVREYLALVGTKAFVIGLLVAPLMLGVAVLVGDGGGKAAQSGSRVLPLLRAQLEAGGHTVQVEPPEGFDAARQQQLGDAVRAGKLLAIVEIDAQGAEPTRIYQEHVPGSGGLADTVGWAVQLARLEALGVPERDAKALLHTADVDRLPPPGGDAESADEAALAQVLAPVASVFLVFIAVMTASMPLLQAVIEEKQQRIAEVLLGAVSPFQLMAGKLLGAVGVVLTTLLYYVGLGWLGAAYLGLTEHVPLHVVATALVVAALASVLYGAIFLAVGAAASDLKDAQGLMTPLFVVLFAPLVLVGPVMAEPNSLMAVGLSLFPLTAPMFMPTRMALGTLPGWQLALALGLTLATMLGVLWAAGRIFRIGILSHGRMPGLRELARWLRA